MSQKKPPVSTVEFMKAPKVEMYRTFKLGLIHHTPDYSVPLGRHQVKMLAFLWFADKYATGKNPTIEGFADFICNLLVKYATEGLNAYNSAIKRVIVRGFTRQNDLIISTLNDLKPYVRDKDKDVKRHPGLGNISKSELLAETGAIHADRLKRAKEGDEDD
jgi:hypothetical protein